MSKMASAIVVAFVAILTVLFAAGIHADESLELAAREVEAERIIIDVSTREELPLRCQPAPARRESRKVWNAEPNCDPAECGYKLGEPGFFTPITEAHCCLNDEARANTDILILEAPKQGVVTLGAHSNLTFDNLTYTQTGEWVGMDSFTYQLCPPNRSDCSEIVTAELYYVRNHPPRISNLTENGQEDWPVIIRFEGTMCDIDGDMIVMDESMFSYDDFRGEAILVQARRDPFVKNEEKKKAQERIQELVEEPFNFNPLNTFLYLPVHNMNYRNIDGNFSTSALLELEYFASDDSKYDRARSDSDSAFLSIGLSEVDDAPEFVMPESESDLVFTAWMNGIVEIDLSEFVTEFDDDATRVFIIGIAGTHEAEDNIKKYQEICSTQRKQQQQWMYEYCDLLFDFGVDYVVEGCSPSKSTEREVDTETTLKTRSVSELSPLAASLQLAFAEMSSDTDDEDLSVDLEAREVQAEEPQIKNIVKVKGNRVLMKLPQDVTGTVDINFGFVDDKKCEQCLMACNSKPLSFTLIVTAPPATAIGLDLPECFDEEIVIDLPPRKDEKLEVDESRFNAQLLELDPWNNQLENNGYCRRSRPDLVYVHKTNLDSLYKMQVADQFRLSKRSLEAAEEVEEGEALFAPPPPAAWYYDSDLWDDRERPIVPELLCGYKQGMPMDIWAMDNDNASFAAPYKNWIPFLQEMDIIREGDKGDLRIFDYDYNLTISPYEYDYGYEITTYTPHTPYIGTDSFEYRLCPVSGIDGECSNTATVSVTYVANLAPITADQYYQFPEDTAFEFNLADHRFAIDPDCDDVLSSLELMTFDDFGGTAHVFPTYGEGKLGPYSYWYIPSKNFNIDLNGYPGFTFRLKDDYKYAEKISKEYTLFLQINPVDDAPIVTPYGEENPETVFVYYDSNIRFHEIDATPYYKEVDGDEVVIVISTENAVKQHGVPQEHCGEKGLDIDNYNISAPLPPTRKVEDSIGIRLARREVIVDSNDGIFEVEVVASTDKPGLELTIPKRGIYGTFKVPFFPCDVATELPPQEETKTESKTDLRTELRSVQLINQAMCSCEGTGITFVIPSAPTWQYTTENNCLSSSDVHFDSAVFPTHDLNREGIILPNSSDNCESETDYEVLARVDEGSSVIIGANAFQVQWDTDQLKKASIEIPDISVIVEVQAGTLGVVGTPSEGITWMVSTDGLILTITASDALDELNAILAEGILYTPFLAHNGADTARFVLSDAKMLWSEDVIGDLVIVIDEGPHASMPVSKLVDSIRHAGGVVDAVKGTTSDGLRVIAFETPPFFSARYAVIGELMVSESMPLAVATQSLVEERKRQVQADTYLTQDGMNTVILGEEDGSILLNWNDFNKDTITEITCSVSVALGSLAHLSESRPDGVSIVTAPLKDGLGTIITFTADADLDSVTRLNAILAFGFKYTAGPSCGYDVFTVTVDVTDREFTPQVVTAAIVVLSVPTVAVAVETYVPVANALFNTALYPSAEPTYEGKRDLPMSTWTTVAGRDSVEEAYPVVATLLEDTYVEFKAANVDLGECDQLSDSIVSLVYSVRSGYLAINGPENSDRISYEIAADRMSLTITVHRGTSADAVEAYLKSIMIGYTPVAYFNGVDVVMLTMSESSGTWEKIASSAVLLIEPVNNDPIITSYKGGRIPAILTDGNYVQPFAVVDGVTDSLLISDFDIKEFGASLGVANKEQLADRVSKIKALTDGEILGYTMFGVRLFTMEVTITQEGRDGPIPVEFSIAESVDSMGQATFAVTKEDAAEPASYGSPLVTVYESGSSLKVVGSLAALNYAITHLNVASMVTDVSEDRFRGLTHLNIHVNDNANTGITGKALEVTRLVKLRFVTAMKASVVATYTGFCEDLVALDGSATIADAIFYRWAWMTTQANDEATRYLDGLISKEYMQTNSTSDLVLNVDASLLVGGVYTFSLETMDYWGLQLNSVASADFERPPNSDPTKPSAILEVDMWYSVTDNLFKMSRADLNLPTPTKATLSDSDVLEDVYPVAATLDEDSKVELMAASVFLGACHEKSDATVSLTASVSYGYLSIKADYISETISYSVAEDMMSITFVVLPGTNSDSLSKYLAGNVITYTPMPDFNGADTHWLTLSNSLETWETTYSGAILHVMAVNDNPTISFDTKRDLFVVNDGKADRPFASADGVTDAVLFGDVDLNSFDMELGATDKAEFRERRQFLKQFEKDAKEDSVSGDMVFGVAMYKMEVTIAQDGVDGALPLELFITESTDSLEQFTWTLTKRDAKEPASYGSPLVVDYIGARTSSLTIVGSVSALNYALANLNIVSETDDSVVGLTELTITVDDGGNIGAGKALTATLKLPIRFSPLLEAKVEATEIVKICDDEIATIDGSVSTGGKLKYRWEFVDGPIKAEYYASLTADGGIFDGNLREAEGTSGIILELDANQIPSGAYSFQLVLKDHYKYQAISKTTVNVFFAKRNSPIVEVTTPGDLNFLDSATVRLSADLTISQCAEVVDNLSVELQWRYYKVVSSKRRALSRGDEIQIDGATSRVFDRVSIIDAGVLEVGQYEAEFTACTTDSFGDTVCSSDSIYFTIIREFVAVIPGDARQVGFEESLTLSAVVSHTGARHRWIVYDLKGNVISVVENDDDIKKNALDLILPAKTLKVGEYMVEFAATMDNGDLAESRVFVTVVDGVVPTALIETIINSNDVPVTLTDQSISYAMPEQELTVTGHCSDGEPRWESSTFDLKDVAVGGITSETLIIKAGVVTLSLGELNLRLTCTEGGNKVGIYETTVYVNSPPTGGTCEVVADDKKRIFQLDRVEITCKDWIDPDTTLGNSLLYYTHFHDVALEGTGVGMTPFSVSSPNPNAPLVVPAPADRDGRVTIVVMVADHLGLFTEVTLKMRVRPFKGDCKDIVEVIEEVLVPANQQMAYTVVTNFVMVVSRILNVAEDSSKKEVRCRTRVRYVLTDNLLTALHNQQRFGSTNRIVPTETLSLVHIVDSLFGRLEELNDKAASNMLEILEILAVNLQKTGLDQDTANMHLANLDIMLLLIRDGRQGPNYSRKDALASVVHSVDGLAAALLVGKLPGYDACASSKSIEIAPSRLFAGDIQRDFKTTCSNQQETSVVINSDIFGKKVGERDIFDLHLIAYKNEVNIFHEYDNDDPISDIVRINIRDANGDSVDTSGPFAQRARIKVSRNGNNKNKNLDPKRFRGHFFDTKKNKWSRDGVTVVDRTKDMIEIRVDHFTDFAVLLGSGAGGDGSGSGSPEIWDWIMITSLVMVGVAILLVIIICVVYDVRRRRYHAKHDKILESRLSTTRNDSTIGGGSVHGESIGASRSENV